MPRWSEVVELVAITYTQNEYGDYVKSETKREVFANKKSVRQSEFYQAAISDFKPELMFVVRFIDYEGEESLIYNEKKYKIIRTHSTQDEFIELVCEGLTNANA